MLQTVCRIDRMTDITVVWSCNVALWVEVWDISLVFVESRISLVVRLKTVRLSHPCAALPTYPFTQTLSPSWFCYYLCQWIKCGMDLSPHTASVTRWGGLSVQDKLPKNRYGPLGETGQAVWSLFFFWWPIIWDPYISGSCAWVVQIPKLSRKKPVDTW